ncbi:SusC/RagA family TonB-linked outer membrane protein [Butyricimonas faecalis]|uniref:SusC/RagA family TonB-linked outer membrane protein n=2 Tax=Butyricimonas faecalis TaxID=2093856 RepID=A0A3S9VSR2_9BACT|nr:SusC/RagA family TonB-linked outer membrane protein [Butyricimonas faecalis]
MKKKLNACYCRRQWPKKMLRVMKIGFFLLVLGLTSVHATTFSQQKVNLNVKNVTLLHVLDLLQEQSEFSFLFSSEDVKNVTNLSVKAKNEDLFEVLRRCLQGTALSFEVNGDLVVLKLQAKTGEPEKKTLKVKGFVFDAKKLSMPGVTVKVVGTSIGTVTDARGWFQILLPMTHGKLEFSFVGYKSKQVDFTEKVDTLRVMLEENIEELEGVVVTGMFTRKAESFTGSASTFKREDILRAGNQNLIKSLKNLDPAFQISENLEFGSDPNRMPDVQLRGQTSFANVRGDYEGNPNQPLFILDGFETTIEKVFDLDMNRVASVTLLKDAAAKAIYGSKAGNGVVVIETVRPKSGELRVYYSGDFGIEAPDLTSYDLMNAEEKLAYEVKIGMYSPDTHPGIITAHQSYKKVYDDVQRGVNTYWLSKPLHVGFSNKHSLTLEGGDEQMRYQFGVSYNSVSGVMKESGRNTLNANTTLSYTYRNLLFRNTIEFTRNWSKNSPYGSFAEYTSLNPYWAPYDDEGNLNRVFLVHSGKDDNTSYSDIEVYNPLYNATLNTKDESNYTEIRDNFSMDWNISGALRVVGGFSYSRQENGADIYYPKNHTKFIHYDENGMSDRKGQYTKKDGYSENIAVQAGLNFNKTLGEHLFFANLTWNIATSNSRSTSTVGEGFGNDSMDDLSFATKYEKNGKPTGNNGKMREVGVIGALNYAYANRYLFDASIRKSASSVYGSDTRWGTFWSLGIGWNIYHEKFLEGNNWLTNFKLRASMGYTGTQNVDPAQARYRYDYYDYSYGDMIGAQLVALANNKLKWQRNMDYNFGADIAIQRLLTLRAEYYIQVTDDLLSDISLPPSNGFTSYKENLGKIENRGFELAVALTPWRNEKQHAYVTFTATALHNENKIKKIYDIFKNSNDAQNSSLEETYDGYIRDTEVLKKYLNKYTKPATLYYEGCSMTAIWGMRSLGIDPATGQEMFLTKEGKSTYTWSAAEQVVVGDQTPKLSGTIGINAGYKGFTLSVACSYKLGGDLYNSSLIARMENVNGYENLDRRILKAWQKPGDISPYKATIINGDAENGFTKPTSRFVQKNNELYVSSVNVGYDFVGAKWLKKVALQRLKLSFYMNELLRLSSVDIERGTSYPFARNFSFSLQATF